MHKTRQLIVSGTNRGNNPGGNKPGGHNHGDIKTGGNNPGGFLIGGIKTDGNNPGGIKTGGNNPGDIKTGCIKTGDTARGTSLSSGNLELPDSVCSQIFILAGSSSIPSCIQSHLRCLRIKYSLFRNIPEILDMYKGYTPACILTILDVPGDSSAGRAFQPADIITLRRTVEDLFLPLPILVLPFKQDSYMQVMEGLRNGAMDFLLPGQSPKLWGEAITRSLNRSACLIERLISYRQVWSRFTAMTNELQEIAVMVFDGKSNQNMVDQTGKSLRTIEDRRAKLFKAMKADSFADLIRQINIALNIQQQKSEIFPWNR